MKKNKGINITMNCKICGKPISQSTDFGMTCEDECEQKQWEKENGKTFVFDDEINNFFGGPMGNALAGMFDMFKGQENLGGQMTENKDGKSIVNDLAKNIINNNKKFKDGR